MHATQKLRATLKLCSHRKRFSYRTESGALLARSLRSRAMQPCNSTVEGHGFNRADEIYKATGFRR